MKVLHTKESNGGIFYVNEADRRVALLNYRMQDETNLVIEHTEVDKDMEGQGIGKELVYAAASFARESNYKVVPECSYAHHVFEMDSSLSDVLK